MNILETTWASLFEGRNHQLVLALISFVVHELVYFGRYLPFYILERTGWLQQYKIQIPKKPSSKPPSNSAAASAPAAFVNAGPTEQLRVKCLKGLMFNHFFIQLPLMLLFHPLAEVFGMKVVDIPFPHWIEMVKQISIFFFFEDFYHYWMHQLLHYGPFYKYIHKIHHEFASPFGMTAEYAHWLETIILGIGTIGGPLLWVYYTADLHMITVLGWIVLRLFQTVDCHSGYDFPWSLRHFMPFWGGADFHDYHHMAFIGNYSSSFRHWDWLFGTDKGYNTWKQKTALANAKLKSSTTSHKEE